MTSTDVFEGIAAVSQLGMMFAVSGGVWVAYRQLHAWREQDLLKKKAEVSEELLATALEISDTLRGLRTPFDSIPESERENRGFVYQKRLERFDSVAGKFEVLRRLQLRAFALLGTREIDEAVDTLFDVRQSTIVAIQMLRERPAVYGDEDEETRELYKRLHGDMWGIYSEKYDPLGMKQLAAIDTLKKKLTPFIRYQEPVVKTK